MLHSRVQSAAWPQVPVPLRLSTENATQQPTWKAET